MKKPTKRQLDTFLATGRTAADEAGDVRDLECALVLAHTLLARHRQLPSALIMRIIAMAKHWPEHDIPTVVVEARKRWFHMREQRELAAKLQGEGAA